MFSLLAMASAIKKASGRSGVLLVHFDFKLFAALSVLLHSPLGYNNVGFIGNESEVVGVAERKTFIQHILLINLLCQLHLL